MACLGEHDQFFFGDMCVDISKQVSVDQALLAN